MVFNFTPERPVLYFRPRSHTASEAKKYILWPAWAYRVVAPCVGNRPLNVLQRAAMGLLRAGIYRPDDHATALCIHHDLAVYIISQLHDKGYLDSRNILTASGHEVIESDSLESQEMVAGYVFQDPWTGELWPRFVERLDYCELEYGESRFPLLLLGTKGKPFRRKALMVLPRTERMPDTPGSLIIMDAVSRHRRALRFNEPVQVDDEADDVTDMRLSSVEAISRVSFVEEQPQPIFLTTFVYVPSSNSDAVDWYVCDPFGLGRNAQLRKRIEMVMADDALLFDQINHVVGKTIFDSYDDQRKFQEQIELKAKLEVERRLTLNIRLHGWFDQVLALESGMQEIIALGEECPARKVDEVLRGGVKVLEAAFSEMVKSHPLGDIWKRVYVKHHDKRTGKEYLQQQQDRKLLAAIYSSAIARIGFAEPIPNAFISVPPGHIRSAADYGAHWRLRPLVTAISLAADREESHPLRTLAKSDAQLLSLVDQIANKGGGAGHAGGESATTADAEQQVEDVYKFLSIFLGTGTTGHDESISPDGESDGQAW